MLECYVRVYNGNSPSEKITSSMMFEIERNTEKLAESGFPLEWEDKEGDDGN